MSKEVLPNPADMFQSLRYLQDQATRGHFKGRSSALAVLTYLVTNMWVKIPNNDDAGLGQVMYGRSTIDAIAAATANCRSTVKSCLKWLADEGWVETERTYASTGREDRRYLMVMLDSRAHRERERRRAAGEALDRIVREGSEFNPREGSEFNPREGSEFNPS